jgi:archaellum component FlaC
VIDGTGTVVRELEGPRKPGLHRVQWDLRHKPLEQDEDGGSSRRAPQGPLVRPGVYHVSLNVDEHEASTSITVEADPELDITEADRQKRWETLDRVLPLMANIRKGAEQSGSLKDQLDELEKSLKEQETIPDEIKESVKGLVEEVELLSHRMNRMSSEVSRLYRVVESSPFVPTETQIRVLGEIEARYRSESASLDELTGTKIPALERQLNEHQVPRIKVGSGPFPQGTGRKVKSW